MMAAGLDSYITFFEGLEADKLGGLYAVVTEDVHFRDPFNDVIGQEAMRKVLKRMFEDVDAPKMTVTHRAWDGEVAFIRWRFTGRIKALKGREWSVIGMSELRFGADGRVSEHIDHWDAARGFYEMIPILGSLIRFIRRRASIG